MKNFSEKNIAYSERLNRIISKDLGEKEVEIDEIDPDTIIDMAYDNLEAGNIDDARDLFLINLQVQGNSVESLNGLAISLCEKGEPEKGLIVMKRALELYPDDPVTVANMGTISCEANDYAAGIFYLHKSLEIDPMAADTHLSLIELYMMTGDIGMAFISCNNALSLLPKDPALSDMMKEIILEMGVSNF